MSEEHDLLRRRLVAMGDVNRRLRAELDQHTGGGRFGLAEPWVASLAPLGPNGSGDPPALVRGPSGAVYLIEHGTRRVVASGLLADVLEAELGERRRVDDVELDGWAEGPPVEVLEAPDGPPFIVVGGERRPLRGLPLPYPVAVAEAEQFALGAELDLGHPHGRDDSARGSGTDAELAPLPTFLIIGAQKSATRWLRANLGQHPDIYAAPSELEFFNNDAHFQHQGPQWYRAQFGGWNGEPIVGESTPGYMMWRHQPEVMARRIRKVVPEARLIAILRNPVDRAYSAMVHHVKRERLPAGSDLLVLARSTPPEDDFLGLIAGGWYAASLRPFARMFGHRLLVLLHDDVATDAPGVYAKAADHVGADPAFEPPQLAKVRFSNQTERPPDDDPLSPEDRLELYEYFRRDVQELEELLGRDLSAWDPVAAGRSAGAPRR
jgi:hypothetical protein